MLPHRQSRRKSHKPAQSDLTAFPADRLQESDDREGADRPISVQPPSRLLASGTTNITVIAGHVRIRHSMREPYMAVRNVPFDLDDLPDLSDTPHEPTAAADESQGGR